MKCPKLDSVTKEIKQVYADGNKKICCISLAAGGSIAGDGPGAAPTTGEVRVLRSRRAARNWAFAFAYCGRVDP